MTGERSDGAGSAAQEALDAARFDEGVLAGQYPQPADPAADGSTVTTGASRWLGIRCGTCNQTFRHGDRVRLEPGVGVQHLDPALRCAATGTDGAQGGPGQTVLAGPDAQPFTVGLLRAWPPVNGVPVIMLTVRDWQVTRPGSGSASPVCPGCGHTFRAGDAVIICPCAEGPDDERRASCQLTVHRDPAAGLACWDDWRPDGRLIRCPRTHEKLPD